MAPLERYSPQVDTAPTLYEAYANTRFGTFMGPMRMGYGPYPRSGPISSPMYGIGAPSFYVASNPMLQQQAMLVNPNVIGVPHLRMHNRPLFVQQQQMEAMRMMQFMNMQRQQQLAQLRNLERRQYMFPQAPYLQSFPTATAEAMPFLPPQPGAVQIFDRKWQGRALERSQTVRRTRQELSQLRDRMGRGAYVGSPLAPEVAAQTDGAAPPWVTQRDSRSMEPPSFSSSYASIHDLRDTMRARIDWINRHTEWVAPAYRPLIPSAPTHVIPSLSAVTGGAPSAWSPEQAGNDRIPLSYARDPHNPVYMQGRRVAEPVQNFYSPPRRASPPVPLSMPEIGPGKEYDYERLNVKQESFLDPKVAAEVQLWLGLRAGDTGFPPSGQFYRILLDYLCLPSYAEQGADHFRQWFDKRVYHAIYLSPPPVRYPVKEVIIDPKTNPPSFRQEILTGSKSRSRNLHNEIPDDPKQSGAQSKALSLLELAFRNVSQINYLGSGVEAYDREHVGLRVRWNNKEWYTLAFRVPKESPLAHLILTSIHVYVTGDTTKGDTSRTYVLNKPVSLRDGSIVPFVFNELAEFRSMQGYPPEPAQTPPPRRLIVDDRVPISRYAR